MRTKHLFLTCITASLLILGFASCSDDDKDESLSTTIVHNLAFTDQDLNKGYIGGDITWDKLLSTENVSGIVIYSSTDGSNKETKLAEVTPDIQKLTIETGTVYFKYAIVVLKDKEGKEYTDAVRLEIIDRTFENTKFDGIYILNSGKQGANNASLSFFDFDSKQTTYKVFQNENGKAVGEVAQDMLVYGSKMYVAVYGSNLIYVTDKTGKIVGEIKPTNNGQPQGPRNLTGYEGKVYATLYDGYLAKIDTTELKIEKQVKVGRNPEYVKAVNNKLYVANSGGMDYNTAIGYDKTVSVVDVASFTEKKQIPVVINPIILSAPNSNGDIYLISNGNYKDVPNTLQKINTTTDTASTLTDINGTWMSMNHDNLYLIYSQYDENWNQKISYLVYDTKTEKLITDNFITDGTVVEKPYSISTDPVNNYVYISTSDYKTNGNMFIFTSAGKLVSKFDTGGLNPMGAYYVSTTK